MGDKLILDEGKLLLLTEEEQHIELPEEHLAEMFRSEIEAPIQGAALPDGIKFLEWRAPFLCAVHQLPAHVRQLRWITHDSPAPYGEGARFQMRRLSIPYAVTFALYYERGGRLGLLGSNELYFRNEPLRQKTDGLGYPALLNVSRIDTPERQRSWICTQHLQCDHSQEWTQQLGALLDHTWNGAFNLSSEHHEGASWYGESQGIHPDLHPIERWEQATSERDAFALSVPWKPVPMNVGELMEAMLHEAAGSMRGGLARRLPSRPAAGIVQRLLNFRRKPK